MHRLKYIASFLLIAFAAFVLSSPATAQSDEQEPSLGDLARSLKKSRKEAEPAVPVITNENFGQMQELIKKEQQNIAVAAPTAPVQDSLATSQAPQATCSLAFNAADNRPAQLDPNPIELDLPNGELAKLDGPALISGDTVQLSIFNGTNWSLREITIGLTIVKHENQAANTGLSGARIVPASAAAGPTLRRSDITLLYHLKGSAAPFSTASFREALGLNLDPDQEWHWAILQARGLPPK